jgi:thymidine phosphorylase
MLLVAGVEADRDMAAKRCNEVIANGQAAEKFARMVAALGGPADFVDNHATYLPKANVVHPVHTSGIVCAVDTRAVGNAIIELGGGRRQVGEALDLSVGFSRVASVGTKLDENTPLAVIHADSEDDAAVAERNLLAAISVGQEAPADRPVVCEILTG